MEDKISRYLFEAVNIAVDADDVYETLNDIVSRKTKEFTEQSGEFDANDLGSALIIKGILEEKYETVELIYPEEDDLEQVYKITYSAMENDIEDQLGESFDPEASHSCPYCKENSLRFIEYQGNYALLSCDNCGGWAYADDGGIYTEDQVKFDKKRGLFVESKKRKKKHIGAGLGGLQWLPNPGGGMGAFNHAMDVGPMPSSSMGADCGGGGGMGESLEEAIEKHDELNPKLFDGDEIKEEVKDKLLDIVDHFKDKLAEDDIDIDIEDERIVGSNASYNYTAGSDIDLHLSTDLSAYGEQEDLAEKLYNAYRSLYNQQYDPTIYGHEVEIFIEPAGEENVTSNGVYSLRTGWVKEPNIENIPDDTEVPEEYADWVARADSCDTVEEIDSFIDDLYKLRQDSILKDGEYGKGNLIFKEIRNSGLKDALEKRKIELVNKSLSLY